MKNVPNCAFVLSVEQGILEHQAALLVESLRQFGGAYADCPIYAVSPRPSRQMSKACQRILQSMGVEVVIEDLLSAKEEYGSIARLAACCWAEKHLTHEILVSLDDDLFFAREPDFQLAQSDLFARPVDVKGMCTTGPADPCDLFWRQAAQLSAVDYEKIPWLETTVDHERIKASYNGGMIAVRRQLGLFERAQAMYQVLKRNHLAPRSEQEPEIFASTGFVGKESSRWWGSSQAVLSLAATQAEARITIAPADYNVPAHLVQYAEQYHSKVDLRHAILVHYHWLLDRQHWKEPDMFYGADSLPDYILAWLRQRTPLREQLT